MSAFLDVLRAQGAPGIPVAEKHFEREAAIRAERYRPDREREELAKLRDETVAGLLAAQDERLASIAASEADDAEALAAERVARVRDGRTLAPLRQLRADDDPAEVRGYVESAERDGLAEQAIAEARRVVKRFAADEQRRHVIGGRWFQLLIWLDTRPGGRGVAAPRVQHDEQRRRVRELTAAVARACGLDEMLKRADLAARHAERHGQPPQAGPSRIQVGPAWDRLAAARRGR